MPRIDIYEDGSGLRWRAGQYGFGYVPVSDAEVAELGTLKDDEEQRRLKALVDRYAEDD